MSACKSGNLPLIEVLLSAGANVNRVDRTGASALFYVSGPHKGPKLKIIKMLREGGCALDLRNDIGVD